MPIITISHSAFGAGRELAERVASVLDHPCISRELLIEASKLYGIPETSFSEVLETEPHWWKRWRENLRLYKIALRAAMCELAQNGKLVYHGHAGQEFFTGVSHVLRVLLTAPMEYRLEQVRLRKGLGEQEARDFLEETDRIRAHRLKAIFGADWRDPSRYDLVLNIFRMNLETAAELVIETSQKQEFQPTAESLQAFRDLTITTRVQAALVMSPKTRDLDITVDTKQGEVSLYGLLSQPELEEKVMRLAGGVPGVGKVIPNFISRSRALASLRARE
ncbi:MAG: cytidylate kinase family protein [Deltaproteobacteria bacterium]|nr:cytidylate kinase family protein [Deltaproteobacteria bacterium]